MNGVKLVGGIALITAGTWITVLTAAELLERQLVSYFWRNQSAHRPLR